MLHHVTFRARHEPRGEYFAYNVNPENIRVIIQTSLCGVLCIPLRHTFHATVPFASYTDDGVPMRLVMETVGKVMPGIGLYLKCQYTEHGQDTMSALR